MHSLKVILIFNLSEMILMIKIQKEEYNYLFYMSFVKIIGFIQLNQKFINKSELNNIIIELNSFFDGKYLFDENNIIILGKKIIDSEFPNFFNEMISGVINPEISITKDVLDRINENLQFDKKNGNYKNLGDMLSDYENGKYYRFFRNINLIKYNCSRRDICFGETIYHSFARFYSEGIDEYFKYFKEMDRHNLINHQNQNQECGFCNCVPCSYWFLNSKDDLKYYNELINTKKIKLNHIAGNEHGPSSFKIVAKMLFDDKYFDRRIGATINLDEEFRNILFETIFNIVKSNYSIAYDNKLLLELFNVFSDNDYIKESIQYIISTEGIEKQKENNKYPIVRGGIIDNSINEQLLNSRLNFIVDDLKSSKRLKKIIKKS